MCTIGRALTRDLVYDERNDYLPDSDDRTPTCADDLRLERPRPIPRHLDLNVPGGVGQHGLRPRPVTDVARSDTGRSCLA